MALCLALPVQAIAVGRHGDRRTGGTAFEPRVYESSGYRLTRQPIRFLDHDGIWKTLVYRGGMYAELLDARWPDQLVDLRSPTV